MSVHDKLEFSKKWAIENLIQVRDDATFERSLCDPKWSVRFQPILSFLTGEVYGYRVEHKLRSFSPGFSLRYAKSTDKLAHFERIIWEQVLNQWPEFPTSRVLFLPVCMYGFSHFEFTVLSIGDLLRKAELSPSQVVLDITDCVPCRISEQVEEKFHEFRKNGYKIAFGNLGNKYSWLHNILLLRPDYVILDQFLVENIHQDNIRTRTLEIVLDLARKLHFQVIAKGIMNVEDLHTLLRMGTEFGQGPVLGQSIHMFPGSSLEGTHIIQEWLNCQENRASKRAHGLESIINPAKTIEEQTPVAEVVQYFNEYELETGIVVVRNEKPIGLVMRNKLFQNLAFKYGYALYWKREISNLMDQEPLILEMGTTLEMASRLSMARHQNQIYDLVIATQGGKLAGIVAISDMLNEITQIQMELARDANPLTGLPGNRRIEREIEQRIEAEQSFTIIYTDLDHFKWFNDQYGFQKGDSVINSTANLLMECLERLGEPGDFVGHIGGDDFILITQTKDLNSLCHAMISRFDHDVPRFYSDSKGYPEVRVVTDRSGQPVCSTGIAISLAVLECHDVKRSEVSLEWIAEEAGYLKKLAKSTHGSTSVRGSLQHS